MPFRRNWLTCCVWWLLAAATVHAQPTVTLTTDIAPQPLYRALAAFPGTLVFYMGLHRIEAIAASLVQAGNLPQRLPP